MKKLTNFRLLEPLKSNRWIIETKPEVISTFLFRKYKFYNDGNELIFETEFYETIDGVVTPDEIMSITDIQLKYLDPTGAVVSGYHMRIKGINFFKEHSYSDEELLYTKLFFKIKDVNPIFVKNLEQREVETLAKTEKCVCCGNDTGVLKSSNIVTRNSYVEGSGQLCNNCFLECFKNAK